MPLSLWALQGFYRHHATSHTAALNPAFNTPWKCLQGASPPATQGMQALFAAILPDIYDLEAEQAANASRTGVDGDVGGPPCGQSAVAEGKLKRGMLPVRHTWCRSCNYTITASCADVSCCHVSQVLMLWPNCTSGPCFRSSSWKCKKR